MIKPWTIQKTQPLGHFRVFSLRSDTKISPRTGTPHDFYILDSVDWVNVIALTTEQEIVLIEQYRHGTNTIELEIPGGIMDPEDASPVATGVRELREETGYEGDEAAIIGKVFSNPAIMTNSTYTVLVKNCQLKHPVEFDQCEDLVTRLVPAVEAPKLVHEGKIRHSLVVAALYNFELWRRFQ